MTTVTADIDTRAAGLGLFEKWLSVWVGAVILAGIALGNVAPELFASLASIEYASVMHGFNQRGILAQQNQC